MKGLLSSIFVGSALMIGFIANSFLKSSNADILKIEANQSAMKKGACLACHISTIKKIVKHQPTTYDCLKCHKSNNNKHPQKGTKGFALIHKNEDLCFICHTSMKEQIEKADYKHNAIKGNKHCISCHSPHSSDNKYLLIKKEKDLCLSCHTSECSNASSTNFTDKDHKNKAIDNKCTNCHSPHFSNNKFFIKDEKINNDSIKNNNIVVKIQKQNPTKSSNKHEKIRSNKPINENLNISFRKKQNDTCTLANFCFIIIDFNSDRNLYATINKNQLEIRGDEVNQDDFKVIHYILSSIDNPALPIIRNHNGNVSYKALNLLKNAQIGSQYVFEEIVVVNSDGVKMENQVRAVLIERVK